MIVRQPGVPSLVRLLKWAHTLSAGQQVQLAPLKPRSIHRARAACKHCGVPQWCVCRRRPVLPQTAVATSGMPSTPIVIDGETATVWNWAVLAAQAASRHLKMVDCVPPPAVSHTVDGLPQVATGNPSGATAIPLCCSTKLAEPSARITGAVQSASLHTAMRRVAVVGAVRR